MLTVLLKDGTLPDEAILNKVVAACSIKTLRPLTDNVQAQVPTEDTYNIALTYYISRELQAEETAIRALIENAGGIIDQYEAWQQGDIGRAVNPDELRRMMLTAGACRIDLSAPAYAAVAETHLARRGTRTINYGGLI